MIEEIFQKNLLIFGCGNTLMGDDGFGPEVIAHLKAHFTLPADVLAEDVGTSIGDLLFDLILSPNKPDQMVLVDAVHQPGRRPGELFELNVSAIPNNKAGDFCMHQFPSVNYLKELQASGMTVRLLAVQMKRLPDMVRPGLSAEVAAAVPEACQWLAKEMGIDGKGNHMDRRYA